MESTLQNYYERIKGLQRQRSITGNPQMGRAGEEELAAGYYDAYFKNKFQSQQLGLQRDQLALNQKEQAESSSYRDRALVANTSYQDRALSSQGNWAALSLGANLLTTGGGLYYKDQASKRIAAALSGKKEGGGALSYEPPGALGPTIPLPEDRLNTSIAGDTVTPEQVRTLRIDQTHYYDTDEGAWIPRYDTSTYMPEGYNATMTAPKVDTSFWDMLTPKGGRLTEFLGLGGEEV